MRHHLGDTYAETYAHDQVIGGLGSRTVVQAFADGEETKAVWRAVWAALELPEADRT